MNGEGGGIVVRQNVNGTVMIHNSVISNNTSESRGGGIKLESQGTLNTTIDQLTRILDNSSLGTEDGISEGGGVDISINAGTTMLKDVTITNNHANGETGNPSDPGTGGGIFNDLGPLNVSLSRITGNTAPTGSGLFRASGTVTAENNWWGCDDFPGAAGCDTVDGTADVDPRLDLVVTAMPPTINEGASSSVTADFSRNSDGATVAPVVLNGLTIIFGAANGNMDPPAAQLAAFMATSTYTNETCPSSGSATVAAKLDNGTGTLDIPITCSTTTTTSSTTTTTTAPTTTTTMAPTTTTTSTSTTITTMPPLTCGGRNATIVSGSGTINGTNGNDVIVGLGGGNVISGGNGDDVICGGNGPDTLNGGNGIDRLFGENDNDILNGNNGNDTLNGGAGIGDACNGGNGTDTGVNCEPFNQ